VLFLFSILFPFLKLLYLLTLMTSPDIPQEFRKKSIAAMEWLGRYSMTDVMVLALMIFYVNSSGYTEAQVQPGVYFFAASALMTMLAYGWANTVPARSSAVAVARNASTVLPAAPRTPAAAAGSQPSSGQLVTLPTNPARRPPKPVG
jgi:paraquat-inducible protein A